MAQNTFLYSKCAKKVAADSVARGLRGLSFQSVFVQSINDQSERSDSITNNNVPFFWYEQDRREACFVEDRLLFHLQTTSLLSNMEATIVVVCFVSIRKSNTMYLKIAEHTCQPLAVFSRFYYIKSYQKVFYRLVSCWYTHAETK